MGTRFPTVIDYSDAFELIAEMARGFSEGRDFDATLARALNSIAAHVRAEAGSLWILDAAEQELACVACVGPNPITGMRLSVTEGIVGRSVRENVCQTVFDVSKNVDFSGKIDEASGFVTRSILCAPMSFSDKVVGALELINKQTQDGYFMESDAEVLQVLASSAGLAISNHRLAAAQIESERLRRELEVATEIQMGMLPRPLATDPDRDKFSVLGALRPAREVGGDFYDFFFLDSDHLCLCIGDVSGKGTPAALFMAMTITLLKSISRDNPSPSSMMRLLNETLSDDNESCMFVTVFLAFLNVETSVLTYTNAGHNPPYLKRTDGSVEPLRARHGPVVGAMGGIEYGEEELQLAPAELLLLYTDGVTEATDSEGQLFSDARLVDLLASNALPTVQDAVKITSDAVEAFEHGTEQADDVTILALRVNETNRPG